MKNNKLLAGLACGIIIGSIGTSFIGNYQAHDKRAGAGDMQRGEAAKGMQNSASNAIDDAAPGNSGSLVHDGTTYEGDGGHYNREGKGRGGKGYHKGQGSLQASEGIDVADGIYNNGTYEGTAAGFGGPLKVEVTIADSAISDIEVTSHSETPGFYEKAFETVPAEIIQSQSTQVDTVSGATYSSVGIINAVNDALGSASSKQ